MKIILLSNLNRRRYGIRWMTLVGALIVLLKMTASQVFAENQSGLNPKAGSDQFSTPAALLENLRVSLANNSEPLFDQCFHSQAEFQECLHQVFRKIQASLHLREEIEKVYGNKGWEQFQDSGKEIAPSPKIVPSPPPTDKEWWSKIEVHVSEGHASFFNPLTQMTNSMMNLSGTWKIEPSTIFSQDVDCAKLSEYLKVTTDAIEEIAAEIKNKKLTIGDIGTKIYEAASRKGKLR